MKIPKLIKIKRTFDASHIEDIEKEVRLQILGCDINIEPNSRIAIAVGSRGVKNINRIVKATVDTIREIGGCPFIIPAMGSHGGATAEGQRQVLEGYGVTEKFIGAEILSSMQVVELPSGDLGHKLYMDKNAYEADGTIIINRVKVHTDFHGTTESGMLKMCVIGIGKHKMALEIHRYGVYGLKELIPKAARHVLNNSNIILGIGIVENEYDETVIIKAVKPEVMEQEEIKLLEYNRRHMPHLPVDELDVLVVDELGKEISGIGIDSNITGRIRIRDQQEPLTPNITNIVVMRLSEGSHGNALGMGLADFITRHFYEKIDFKTTYENVVTSTFTERGKMPIVAETDHQAIEYAIRACGPIDIEKVRIIRIKNTLKMDEMYVSESVLKQVMKMESIDIIGEMKYMLDDKGQLLSF
ncbi:MAG TPA: DUF362 domain-containing protein [Ruminiclostridium sp.]